MKAFVPSFVFMAIGAMFYAAGYFLDDPNLRTVSFLFFGMMVPALAGGFSVYSKRQSE